MLPGRNIWNYFPDTLSCCEVTWVPDPQMQWLDDMIGYQISIVNNSHQGDILCWIEVGESGSCHVFVNI